MARRRLQPDHGSVQIVGPPQPHTFHHKVGIGTRRAELNDTGEEGGNLAGSDTATAVITMTTAVAIQVFIPNQLVAGDDDDNDEQDNDQGGAADDDLLVTPRQ